jgi:hypothetical protein
MEKNLATKVRILARNNKPSYKDLDYSLEKRIKELAKEHRMHLQQIWAYSMSNQQIKII